MGKLDGKVVVVTGAARRIGRCIALRLAEEGATVVVHYNQSAAEAEQTARQCGGLALGANLERVSEIVDLFRRIEKRLGRLDALVNNAARFTAIDPLQIQESDWDYIHTVNLKATFFCCREAARLMKQRGGGRIVNISSLGGLRPWAEHVHYCASKAGVIMLTRALAKAWAPEILVNSVAPGVIPFEEAGNPEIQRLVDATPMKRAGSGEDIASAVLYFLTDARFITGEVLAVDGGLNLR
jgi:3-oxoacyl-[acyl-carrier protein] reductase/pteridine reductase